VSIENLGRFEKIVDGRIIPLRDSTLKLDFAELQALNRRVMHMADWIAKLDDFLKLSERDILTHAGRISHEQALQKAEMEFDKYRALKADEPSPDALDCAEPIGSRN